MVHKESLSYDKTDPISIYEYALPLIDHTLREIVGDANGPSSTILQHVFPKTQILYTTYSQTNLWNHLFSSSLTNIRANGWNARYHQENGNIVVLRLVHLSTSSICSVVIHFFSIFSAKVRDQGEKAKTF